MLFSSLFFIFIYLPIVLLLYYLCPMKWRNLVLFILNFVFYGWGEPVYILLMLFSIALNYFCGLLVYKHLDNKLKAKRILIICIISNLALLCFFKYYDLFAQTLSLIPGVSIATLGLSLPIGISFYTFQTMSYTIDVYRGDAEATTSFVDFGTFVALFPQLIAGPIIRYKDIADQLKCRIHDIDKFASGIRRFIIGLGKKVLIANNIGMLWDIYLGSSELSMLGSWLGIIAFSMQIYFDFSGYSDMAIGLGKMLGLEFLENFNYPYISKSVTEFWHRWHISLGTWFRDYLYIPLGGNRYGICRQVFNIFAVWALTGFWHGASWNFLLWGIYYGVFLTIEKVFLLKKLERIPSGISHIYALLVAVFGWVLFSVENISLAGEYYKAMFGLGSGGFVSTADLYYLKNYAVILIIGAFACMPIGKKLYNRIAPKIQGVLSPVVIVLVLIFSTAYLVDSSYNPFLYFKF